MLRIGEAVQEQIATASTMFFNQFRNRIGGELIVERHDDIAIRGNTFGDFKAPRLQYQGTGIWRFRS